MTTLHTTFTQEELTSVEHMFYQYDIAAFSPLLKPTDEKMASTRNTYLLFAQIHRLAGKPELLRRCHLVLEWLSRKDGQYHNLYELEHKFYETVKTDVALVWFEGNSILDLFPTMSNTIMLDMFTSVLVAERTRIGYEAIWKQGLAELAFMVARQMNHPSNGNHIRYLYEQNQVTGEPVTDLQKVYSHRFVRTAVELFDQHPGEELPYNWVMELIQ